MKIRLLLALAAFLGLVYPAAAQLPPPWSDALVDHLAGDWKVEGQVLGREANHEIRAEWVFNHQFLRVAEKTSADAP